MRYLCFVLALLSSSAFAFEKITDAMRLSSC